jgi:lysine/ornithine N-monooxygenase
MNRVCDEYGVCQLNTHNTHNTHDQINWININNQVSIVKETPTPEMIIGENMKQYFLLLQEQDKIISLLKNNPNSDNINQKLIQNIYQKSNIRDRVPNFGIHLNNLLHKIN